MVASVGSLGTSDGVGSCDEPWLCARMAWRAVLMVEVVMGIDGCAVAAGWFDEAGEEGSFCGVGCVWWG